MISLRGTGRLAALTALFLASACGEPSAVEEMSDAFAGNPSAERIEPLLTEALAATTAPDTEDSRERAGSVLVSFQNEYGVDPMAMLACIPTVSGGAQLPILEFPEAAALCNVELAAQP